MEKQFSKSEKLAALGCTLSSIYLLPAASVQAAVVVNNTPITFNLGDSPVFWDVDGDGNDEYMFHAGTGTYSSYSANLDTFNTFASTSLGGRGMVQATTATGGDDLAPLSPAFMVGPSLVSGYLWGSSQQTYRTVVSSGGTQVGRDFDDSGFVGGGAQYFGFRFDRAGQTHYGWAEINIDLSGAPGGFTVVRWGYEDQPDTALPVAGGATPAAPATPVPVGGFPLIGLTMLGMGAAGLRELRRRRKAEKKH